MNEEYPELSFLSPNERAQYIKDQLSKKKRERLISAKAQFEEFSKQRMVRYSIRKKAHDQKHKQRSEPYECEKQKQEIEIMRARLKAHQENIGMAHSMAASEMHQQEIRAEKAVSDSVIRRKVESDRYDLAMQDVHEKDPRIPGILRKQKLESAKCAADSIENCKLNEFVEAKKKVQQDHEERIKLKKEEEQSKLKPKLSIEDYSRTFFHSGVGVIPVNKGADIYRQQLQDGASDMKKGKKVRDEQVAERTNAAIHIEKTEKGRENLIQELSDIKKVETEEVLRRCSMRGARSGPKRTSIDQDTLKSKFNGK